MRYRVYQSARFASGAAAAGRTLTVYEDSAGATEATLYAAATGATTLTNPYTVPATGIIDFYVDDSQVYGLAQGDSTIRPLRILPTGFGSSVISVKDYGATGDGTTNDTTAIHAARDAAGSGGSLHFPDGTYLVSGLEASVADQTWTLARQAVIYLADADNTSNVIVTANGFTIRGGKIDGNSANQTGTWGSGTFTGDGIKADSVEDLTIEDVEITDCKFMGIDIKEASRVVVRRCYIHTVNASCIHFRGVDDMLMTDNRFYNWARDYTYLAEGNHAAPALHAFLGVAGNRNLIISDNVFTNTDAVKFAFESSGTAGTEIVADSVISNNVFDSNGYPAGGISGMFYRCSMVGNVHINGTGNSHRCGYEIVGEDVMVSGNTIEGGCIALSGSLAASKRLSAVGNTITVWGENPSAIAFGGSTTDIDMAAVDTLIANNVIDTSAATGSVEAIQVACYGSDSYIKRAHITGNLCWGGAVGHGIRLRGLSGCSDVTVADNVVHSFSIGFGDMENDYYDEVTVANNDFRDNTTPISHLATGGTFRFYGNVLTDDRLGMTLNATGNTVQYGSAAPAAGTYLAGDVVYNTAPAASGYVGWVCTVAGTPGTWKGFGVIEA